MKTSIIDEQQIVKLLAVQRNPFAKDYYAFYSSWFGGIIQNPQWMLLPLDDHMVHRGDGIFEAMKAVHRSVYLMDAHLQRLFKSAESIALSSPWNSEQIKQIVLDTLRASGQENAAVRVFLSRGPGNFSADPYDSIGPQLYIAVTKLKHPPLEKYAHGVTIGKSSVPAKPSWMAQVKSCNYLPNVLMRKEAVDRGLDFVISLDEQGYLTESATENLLIVDQGGTLVYPPLTSILKGTTMIRICTLAKEHGIPIQTRPITIEDLEKAQEVMITGTTLDVLPVVQFEGQPISDGKPGAIAKKLYQLLLEDIKNGLHGTSF